MKKFIAITLALVLVCSLAGSAFAAGSPVKPAPVPKPAEKEISVEVKKLTGDSVKDSVSAQIVALEEAEDLLSEEDAAAFKAAYEELQAIDGVVQYFFWLDLGGYTVSEGDYISYSFDCEGENVRVFCNGVECEVTGHYTAKLPSGGAIAIVSD